MIDTDPTPTDTVVLPLAEERLMIGKRVVDRERVRVSTCVAHHEDLALAELSRDLVEVERIAIGREVAECPQVRFDDDFIVVPVVKEVLVKRLFLVEEVRVKRTRTTELFEQPIILRSMEAVVERVELKENDDEPYTERAV